jgi:hypothetical protein
MTTVVGFWNVWAQNLDFVFSIVKNPPAGASFAQIKTFAEFAGGCLLVDRSPIAGWFAAFQTVKRRTIPDLGGRWSSPGLSALTMR